MKRIDSFDASDARKRRLVIIFRGVGESIKSRSCTLMIEEGESAPNLDDALEAATNAILRLSHQMQTDKERYSRG